LILSIETTSFDQVRSYKNSLRAARSADVLILRWHAQWYYWPQGVN